ncbi:DUF4177 domain-containing protein [Petrocella sp. FN5]|uniref:DUF4177 domain-containing protein n=1 Tax=Petrocella sp. FN5 TaxID=3032002 RepID=UPI000CBA04B0|nr:DUF4177 domain-containing protein [Petrocella sp. FN5]MCF8020830.1 DUF4177 domain-containing protein [Vallitaleaceae bacterium]MDF1618709.1 DUF4177 domain-containing protein [Petrocella sp. FN5]PKM52946.1 MAG: DUF4177 domain-containing protein [Firmicutes bacterium HGW-Firmicutes-5]
MKKWKYKVVEFDTKKSFGGGKIDRQYIEDQLNELGRQGWEIISNFTTNEGYGNTKKIVYTFKREEKEM